MRRTDVRMSPWRRLASRRAGRLIGLALLPALGLTQGIGTASAAGAGAGRRAWAGARPGEGPQPGGRAARGPGTRPAVVVRAGGVRELAAVVADRERVPAGQPGRDGPARQPGPGRLRRVRAVPGRRG